MIGQNMQSESGKTISILVNYDILGCFPVDTILSSLTMPAASDEFISKSTPFISRSGF